MIIAPHSSERRIDTAHPAAPAEHSSHEMPQVQIDTSAVEKLMRSRLGMIIEGDAGMQKVWGEMKVHAKNGRSSLVLGQVGAGKESVARGIALLRHDDRFPDFKPSIVRCTTLGDGVAESELFGHEKGAFTSAHAQRKGPFELQQNGVVILDEIGDMPLRIQALLLGVLEDPFEFKRVGSNEALSFNGKVVAATHRDLLQMVQEGKFRADLLSRLRGAGIIIVPSLRERSIAHRRLLIDHFCKNIAVKEEVAESTVITEAAIAHLTIVSEKFPANLRDLRNIIEQAFYLAFTTKSFPIDLKHFGSIDTSQVMSSIAMVPHEFPSRPRGLRAASQQSERDAIENALHANNHSRTQTAQALGISRVTLYNKMKKYGLLQASSGNGAQDVSEN